MIGKTVAAAAILLLASQAYSQTNPNQGDTNPTPGVTSGPAAGSPTSMRSPQAGPLESKHQRKAIREQSQAVRTKTHQASHGKNDETGATGSSTPGYAAPPR